jgi:hypothetical protein
MLSAAQLSTVADLRKTLSPSQRSVLLELDRCGRAYKANNGWKLGGMFRKASTVKPLVSQGFAREDFRDGKHLLVLTYPGRAAIAMLQPPSPALPLQD